MEKLEDIGIHLHQGDVHDAYKIWPSPMTIISDGPYGVGGFPGDPNNPRDLPQIYEPHIEAWAKSANSQTTLWFWCTEVGWATTHPVLEKHGWVYRGCNIWDKGVGHIAGNCNGKTMKKFPVVTEVCVQYTREPEFTYGGAQVDAQQWIRAEWERTGLPFAKANEACGVKNAATRKYLTKDHLFYLPPPDVFAKLAIYANAHGDPAGRPYFDMTEEELRNPSFAENRWDRISAKFNFEYGVTNVWNHPAIRGKERLKENGKALHLNQKPMALIERIMKASSDPGDIVWDVFCGSGTGAVVARKLNRVCYTAEINPTYQKIVLERLSALVP